MSVNSASFDQIQTNPSKMEVSEPSENTSTTSVQANYGQSTISSARFSPWQAVTDAPEFWKKKIEEAPAYWSEKVVESSDYWNGKLNEVREAIQKDPTGILSKINEAPNYWSEQFLNAPAYIWQQLYELHISIREAARFHNALLDRINFIDRLKDNRNAEITVVIKNEEGMIENTFKYSTDFPNYKEELEKLTLEQKKLEFTVHYRESFERESFDQLKRKPSGFDISAIRNRGSADSFPD